VNGTAVKVRVNYVVVGQYVFSAFTSGGGVGDLVVTPVPHIGVPTGVTGYLFVSFDTTGPLGSGPLFGLRPDSFTWPILLSPANSGDLLHWFYVPGLFPDIPLILPAGILSSLAGISADLCQVDLTGGFTLANVTPVRRITF
jgi:hypothetical protein